MKGSCENSRNILESCFLDAYMIHKVILENASSKFMVQLSSSTVVCKAKTIT